MGDVLILFGYRIVVVIYLVLFLAGVNSLACHNGVAYNHLAIKNFANLKNISKRSICRHISGQFSLFHVEEDVE